MLEEIERKKVFRAPSAISFPEKEEEILAYWQKENVFRKGQELSAKKARYTFYDGPPFATGLPHYGHILTGTIKDIVTRYKYQKGFHVERRFGWDCHGMPVEYEIDKALGIKGRKEVEAFGIAAYNQECRNIVMRYSEEWRTVVNRTGRWIDFENDYKTMYPWYMESIWWVFKQLFHKGLIYRGVKVMPFSTHCGTPLSNFEAGLNYKQVQDPSIIVAFEIEDDLDNARLLVWTTTPWTLPSNLAICVNPSLSYVKIKTVANGKHYMICESRLNFAFENTTPYIIVSRFLGRVLVGKKYKPLFPYFQSYGIKVNGFRILSDIYVSQDHGTGIVHLAPYFGEDDYRVCMANGIISKTSEIICPVDENGHFTDEATDLAGLYIKEADKRIIRILEGKGMLFSFTHVVHSYPFCWRSDTPLIYKAVPSWFVRVEHMSEELLASTAQTNWVPAFAKTSRFGNWLKNVQDWSVSRNRFWGTPIPIWTNGDEIVCVGSIRELQNLSGCEVRNLHRESIDHIKIPSACQDKPPLERVEEVFDCWFDSGAMPFAQKHFPFENSLEFEKCFPADFVAEGIDQTRGWFYTLIVISTALYGMAPFTNLIANGLVLASDGQKMSKRKKNYPDPMNIVKKYGADALRLYLINSPVVRGEDIKFREEGVRDIVKVVLIPWYNAYRFLMQNIHKYEEESNTAYFYDESRYRVTYPKLSLVDIWIISCKESLLDFIEEEMKSYRLYTVVRQLITFIEQLTNWYIRLNRRRIKGEIGHAEALMSLDVLYDIIVVMTKIMAPFAPFFSEYMYHRVCLFDRKPKAASVHYLLMPVANKNLINIAVKKSMGSMQKVVELGRKIRDRRSLPLRHPVKEVIVIHSNTDLREEMRSLQSIILEELNAKKLILCNNIEQFGIKMRAKPDYKLLGNRLKNKLKVIAFEIEQMSSLQIQQSLAAGHFEVNGESIETSEIQIIYERPSQLENFEIDNDNDLLVLLNVEENNDLKREGIARDLINRIQNLKKKANLLPADPVSIYYAPADCVGNEVIKIIQDFRPLIESTLKSALNTLPESPFEKSLILMNDRIQLNDSFLEIFIARKDISSESFGLRVNIHLSEGLKERYCTRRSGTVLLRNPAGQMLSFAQFRKEIDTLFGLYGVKLKLKCGDRTVTDLEIVNEDVYVYKETY